MLLFIVKEVFVTQTTFNNMLHTEVSSKLFYSLTILFFLANSLNKTSKLLFIFVRIHRRHAHFQHSKIRLFLVVYKACTIVFQLTPVKLEGKVIHYV